MEDFIVDDDDEDQLKRGRGGKRGSRNASQASVKSQDKKSVGKSKQGNGLDKLDH